MFPRPIARLLLSAAMAAMLAGTASAAKPAAAKPLIVLVHGAFADATGWQRVIPILQRDGYEVIAVQNPLESLAGDVETTKRLVDAQTGPVVLVGHSYGGAVIAGAAAGNPNVKALVFLAAIAPEAGEPVNAFLEKYPSALGAALKPDPAGFLFVDRGKFHSVFAGNRGRGRGGGAKTDQRRRVRRLGSAGRVENHPVLVPGVEARPCAQSRSRAILRQADACAHGRDRCEPRGFHLAAQEGRAADRTSGLRGQIAGQAAFQMHVVQDGQGNSP